MRSAIDTKCVANILLSILYNVAIIVIYEVCFIQISIMCDNFYCISVGMKIIPMWI
jgi:hypothetical protein